MRERIWLLFLSLLFLLLVGCQQQKLPLGDGFVDVPGGPVWYRVIGNRSGTPVLCLHGGPGGNSCYLAPLEALGGERPVVFYDQLGSGRSGRPDDISLWNIDRFVEELDVIRDHLGLNRLHLYGHSWGAMLAVRYMEEKGSEGIVSLILGGPLLSTPHWIADAESLRNTLPDSIQAVLRHHEIAGTTNSDSYRAATDMFYDRFVFHHQPRVEIPECDDLGFINPAVYGYMWGPSEFYATGTLKEYDVSGYLAELTVPVLFLIGQFDEARLETVQKYAEKIPDSRIEVIEGTAHAAMNEEPERYVSILRDFMYDVEHEVVK